jgi:hypothetical protein
MVAMWMSELPDGRQVIGEAADEREAFRMIEDQSRASVTWREGRGNAPGSYRWTMVADDGKTQHGWADTESDAWAQVREVQHRPYRGTNYRGPRCLWVRTG